MTEIPPDQATAQDVAAYRELQLSSEQRAASIQGRAEKWVAGLTSLSGLVATVLVIKGPASVADLGEGAKLGVAVAFGVALLALATGTAFAYCAAYGSPFRQVTVSKNPIVGLATRLLDARVMIENRARRSLATALILVFVGVAALGTGVGVGWFSGAATPAGKFTCVVGEGGETIVKLSGSSAAVAELSEGTLKTC